MRFRDLDVGPSPQLPRETYALRRRRLAVELGPGSAAVIATHPTHQYSHDVDYLFRPHSDFWYLTGFNEPNACLVLHGGSGHTDLFMQPRRKEAEIWTGRRLGTERAPEVLGVDRAYPIEDLPGRLPTILRRLKVHAIADHHPALRRRVKTAAGKWVEDPGASGPGGPKKGAKRPAGGKAKRRPVHARTMLHAMRLVKDKDELRMLQRACDLGVEAHQAAAALVRPGAKEYQVESAFDHHARHRGSTGVGYPSICGCGPNAAVLHYISNLGTLEAGRTFLIDAGCEWGYYTSDITRTYPVGEFSRLQSDLYGVVEKAHAAGIAKVRPGNLFRAPHEAAVAEIVSGLLDLAILEGSFEDAVAGRLYQPYFMHGTSHHLGLDVHDAGGNTEPDGTPLRLREGMVLTVEPGLYFNPEFAPQAPPATLGIGIRIEDDVAVTGSGRKVMTRALPSSQDSLPRSLGL